MSISQNELLGFSNRLDDGFSSVDNDNNLLTAADKYYGNNNIRN